MKADSAVHAGSAQIRQYKFKISEQTNKVQLVRIHYPSAMGINNGKTVWLTPRDSLSIHMMKLNAMDVHRKINEKKKGTKSVVIENALCGCWAKNATDFVFAGLVLPAATA
jgi:hypothetical protein